MDPVQSILLEALKAGAAHDGELRLYRSGKLPGLFRGRTAAHAEAATQALRDGLIEVVRSETKGKATTEWVRVTPKGVDLVVQHESPARAMDALRDALQLNAQNLPAWVAQMRQELDAMSRRVLGEFERIGKRLDRLADHVETALHKAEQKRETALVPWAQPALDYLAGRCEATGQDRCPLPELFAALSARQFEMGIKEFHAGLRHMQGSALLQLLAYDGAAGPPEPEYALPDGPTVLYYCTAMRSE
jgi:DNA-binding PadR family transcriptional regulator